MISEPFKLITREMAAEVLSVSLTTLDAMVAEGAVPAPKPLGSSRRLYWLPEVFYGHLRRMLGDGEVTDSSVKATSTSPDPPQPTHEISAPKRAPSAFGKAKRSDLRTRHAKRMEDLNK